MTKWTSALLTAAAVLVTAGTLRVSGQETGNWTVPEEARQLENPIAPDPAVVEAGAAIYRTRCQLCHGETGKGDGPATRAIQPAPHDVTTTEVQERLTDGEIFYKITVGKAPMPPMEGKLTDEEIWSLVQFIRSLHQM